MTDTSWNEGHREQRERDREHAVWGGDSVHFSSEEEVMGSHSKERKGGKNENKSCK